LVNTSWDRSLYRSIFQVRISRFPAAPRRVWRFRRTNDTTSVQPAPSRRSNAITLVADNGSVNHRAANAILAAVSGAMACGFILGGVLCDAVAFKNATLGGAFARLSPGLLVCTIVFIALIAWTAWRFRDDASEPAGKGRAVRTLRDSIVGAIILTFIVAGDMLISEWIVRSLVMLPWTLAANGLIELTNAWRAAMARRRAVARYERAGA
jgi:hypothetical protein